MSTVPDTLAAIEELQSALSAAGGPVQPEGYWDLVQTMENLFSLDVWHTDGERELVAMIRVGVRDIIECRRRGMEPAYMLASVPLLALETHVKRRMGKGRLGTHP